MTREVTLFLAQNDAPAAAPGSPGVTGGGGAPASGGASGQGVTGSSSSGAGAGAGGAAPHQDPGFFGMGMFPIILVLGCFLAYTFWDSSKKAKKREQLVKSLQKGDRVYTNAGIIGTITDMEDNEVVLRLEDNQKIRLIRSTILGAYESGKTVE